jgi:putative tricarboxylic transport membrane protein
MRLPLFPIALVGICALYLVGARSIPPPIYDALGSAALPVGAALLVAALALVAAARDYSRRAPAVEGEASVDRNGLAAAFAALTVAYVAAMATGLLGYATATAAFAVLAVLLLARLRRSALLPAAALGLLLGFGGQALFTRFFYVALP